MVRVRPVLFSLGAVALVSLAVYALNPVAPVLSLGVLYLFAVLPVALTYANSYAKANVKDNLCGYSFGGVPAGGVPTQISAAAAAQVFGTGNGVPPTAGVQIINNNSVGGAALDAASVSPSTGKADYNYDGAKCLRDQLTAQKDARREIQQALQER